MRFSTVAALCAAPLALAGSLEAEMVARGVNVEVRAADDTKATAEKAAANNGNTIIIQESTSITEVIVIWINNGGNAATQTVNTPAAAAAATAAAVTHTVSLQYVRTGSMLIIFRLSLVELLDSSTRPIAFQPPLETWLSSHLNLKTIPSPNQHSQRRVRSSLEALVSTPVL